MIGIYCLCISALLPSTVSICLKDIWSLSLRGSFVSLKQTIPEARFDHSRASGSEIATALDELRKANSQLQTWITSEGSPFRSHELIHRLEILQNLEQARMLEVKLSSQMYSENEALVKKLYQKITSQLQTWISSAGSPFISHGLTYMKILEKLTQFQAYPPNQQDAPPRNEKKRKSMKVHDIHFEVFRVLVDPGKKLYAYRLNKSATLAKAPEDIHYFPYVNFKRERVGNRHAYHIMAFVNHANILRLKRICNDKSNTREKALMAFVEPLKGSLDSVCPPVLCMDEEGFIPTERCRVAFREVIMGLSFIWKAGLYHGNLNWSTSYCNYTNSVKLANFEMQENVSLEEARIIDRNSLVGMLQYVANDAMHRYPSYPNDLINSLINTISEMDVRSPDGLETGILDNPFFWTPRQRTEFFATTISIKLRDHEFVRNLPSDLCITPWDTSYAEDFTELVQEMNDHRRDTKNWLPYNGKSVEHFLCCICGAYAHKHIIEITDIDGIITRNVPLLVEKLRILI